MYSIHLAILYRHVVVSCIFDDLKVYALSEEIKATACTFRFIGSQSSCDSRKPVGDRF